MSATATSVLIVASDAETMRCWTHALLSDSRLRLIAVVGSHCAGLALLDATAPDVLLLDLAAVEAPAQRERIDLLRHATRHHPRCDCLVVMDSGCGAQVNAAIVAGAAGCLFKQGISPERITGAIHELRAGGAPLDPLIARSMLSRFTREPIGPSAGAPLSLLTQRETEILRLTAKGLMFETIGDLLDISPHTVVAHTRKIYQKLDVHSRGAAVHAATRNGWL